MEYDSWCSSGYEFNREIGAQMGEQSKRLGLQFNFAPVLDINTNPKNPIIGFRSLEKTSIKLRSEPALMKGMQGKGVFPQGNIFLVTGIPTQTPTKDCPPSTFF
jgi:beta-glucosidase-like glycosyl hydrolase